jgi:hypothetical protein
MKTYKGDLLYVNLGPTQTKRRLRGRGFGVKKVQSAGTGQAVIIHTATGRHLQQLRNLFADVLVPEKSLGEQPPGQAADAKHGAQD